MHVLAASVTAAYSSLDPDSTCLTPIWHALS